MSLNTIKILNDSDNRRLQLQLHLVGGGTTLSVYRGLIPDIQTGSGAHSAFYPKVTGIFHLEKKRLGRETDHSSPYSVEVKNVRRYTFTPPIRLHGMMLN